MTLTGFRETKKKFPSLIWIGNHSAVELTLQLTSPVGATRQSLTRNEGSF